MALWVKDLAFSLLWLRIPDPKPACLRQGQKEKEKKKKSSFHDTHLAETHLLGPLSTALEQTNSMWPLSLSSSYNY